MKTAVVIVGASGAGKSTLVRALRAAALPGVAIPPRFVTRPPREGDADGENVFLSPAAFDAQEMAVRWSREVAPGRVERYGFPRVGGLPVYSANNAWPRDAVPGAVIVCVAAPADVRLARLRARSPAQWARTPDELAHRMADPGGEGWAHVVIQNHGPGEAVAAQQLIQVVRDALT